MTYFKIFAISVCTSLLFLSVFIMVAFDSENTLSQAYEHFKNKDYYEARQLLINEDTPPIPLADFYLYEAYLAREELGVKKSHSYLLQAIHELSNKKSSTAHEISLNLALDSFLQNDTEALQAALLQSSLYAAPEDPWHHFFVGCKAYLNRDYEQALKSWEASKTRDWLSNWMKTSFETHLPSHSIALKRLHAEIETGQFLSARNKLEQTLVDFPTQNDEEIYFLLALSYLKEANQVPLEKKGEIFQKSIELLALVPANNNLYVQEKRSLLNIFKEQVLLDLAQKHFDHFSLYITFIENASGHDQIEIVSSKLSKTFNEMVMTGNHEEASILIHGLSKSLPEGICKRELIMKLAKQMYFAISNGNLRHLENYWALYQNFLPSQSPVFEILADATATKVLEVVEKDQSDLQKTQSYISLWKSLEKNAHHRYALAQQLVHKAQRFWAVDEDSQKAIQTLRIAKQLPLQSEQDLLSMEIERAVIKTYRQAVLQDHVHLFPSLQSIAKEFNLTEVELMIEQEAVNQLADAQYLFHTGQFTLAAAKADWVIQILPQEQLARQIAALTAYEEARYVDVIKHINYLTSGDKKILEAWLVSKILTSTNPQEEALLLQELEKRQIITSEIALRIGLSHILASRPDQGIFWLSKASLNDEVLTGLYVASFQKRDWEKVITYFEQLSNPSKQIPAIQSIIIQAYIARNEKAKADHVFSLLNLNHDLAPEEGSKPFILFQKHLNHFDIHDFAARYYLRIKKEPEFALNQMREAIHVTPKLRIERAELAFALKNDAEAIQDLQKSIQESQGSIREKALAVIGNIYFQLGFYPDSVVHFKELFSLQPKQSSLLHQLYGQALVAIGRNDLAKQHFDLLGMSCPSPQIMPQELGFHLAQNISAQKKLNHLKSQLFQYPENISLQILLAREHLLRSENSSHPSEELLLAFEILESLHENYSEIPETWCLKGQVLERLNFNNLAKESLTKCVALNPHYAEAFKHLANINLVENDLIAATYNLKRTLQLIPHDSGIWAMLGNVFEMQGQLEHAIHAITEAARLNPENISYLIKIARLNLALYKPHDAVAAIEQAMIKDPNNSICWKILQEVQHYSDNQKVSKNTDPLENSKT